MNEAEKSDRAAVARLRAMWTPEMFDRFESDVRWLLEASPDFRDRPEAREEIVSMLKQRAMDLVSKYQ